MSAHHELEAPAFLGEDVVVTCKVCGLTFKTRSEIEGAQNETCHPIMTNDYRLVKMIDGTTKEILVGQKLYTKV